MPFYKIFEEIMSLGLALRTHFEICVLRLLKKYGRRALMLEKLDVSCRPVFVYQMSKVGSSSIANSLMSQYDQPVIHGHGFGRNFHNWKIRYLYKVFREGKPLDVITLIREPVSRNVSHFFHDLAKYTGKQPEEFSLASMNLLRSLFLENFEHDLAFNWFEDHIKKKFDIDVYKKALPDCGYQFYEKGRVRLLLLKVECENRIKEEAVKKYLDMSDFTIVSSNIGKDKDYGELYRSFMKTARLPEGYVESMLTSRYFEHFYDGETASRIRKRWCEKQSFRVSEIPRMPQ